MKLNNFMFKEEYAYTYEEVVSKILNEDYLFFDKYTLCNALVELGYIELTSAGTGIQTNTPNYSFLGVGLIDEVVSKNAVDVLNKVALRYKEEYAVVSDTEERNEVRYKCLIFFSKVCNVLDYTFNKYDTLLGIYEAQKSHLLDKLQRVRDEDKTNSASGQHYNTRVLDEDKSNSKSDEHYNTKGTSISSSSESSSQNAHSDTPQTINTSGEANELNGYWDKFDKASDSASSSSSGTETDNGRTSGTGSESTDATETDNGSISSSGSESFDATESYDPMTMMARIEEIQTKYENTMFKWVEEFDRLFIEEGNI